MDTKQRAKLHKRFVERTGQRPSDLDLEKENHKYCRDQEWKVEEAQAAAAKEAAKAEAELELEKKALLSQVDEVQAEEDSELSEEAPIGDENS